MNTAQLELPPGETSVATMHALVYQGPGKPFWESHRLPALQTIQDAIVRITASTICGSDPHILKGDVPTVTKGRILGVGVGGHLANIGGHGKPVVLHMQKPWDRNVTLTTRLCDTVTTPMFIKTVQAGKLQPGKLVTHSFALDDILKACDTFGNAAKHAALKVALKAR